MCTLYTCTDNVHCTDTVHCTVSALYTEPEPGAEPEPGPELEPEAEPGFDPELKCSWEGCENVLRNRFTCQTRTFCSSFHHKQFHYKIDNISECNMTYKLYHE